MSDKTEAQKHRWWIERDAVAIVKLSDSPTEDKIYDSPLAVKEVTLFCVKKDEDFVATTGGTTLTGVTTNAPAGGVSITFTATNEYTAGDAVSLSSFGQAYFNGLTSQVSATNLSTASFELEGVVGDGSITTDTGTVTHLSGAGLTMSESPGIPEEFHENIVDYAIMKGHELSPEGLQIAQYFRNNWDLGLKEGKKYGYKNRRSTTSVVVPYDY